MRHVLRATSSALCLFLFANQIALASWKPRKVSASQAAADDSAIQAPVPSGPVPAQIAAARNVLLTNAGADDGFPRDATQSYNDIFNALQSWGRYKLVGSPADADLIFQFRAIAPVTVVYGTDGNDTLFTRPAFQITILDAKSMTVLWTVTSPVILAGNRKSRERWYAEDVENLTSRLKVLSGAPLSSTETADLTHAPKSHVRLWSVVGVSAFVGTGAAVGIIMKDHFNDAVAQQNADLCKQNVFFCTH